MNCLPSSGARDDRTESCHLLWFWQPSPPGWMLRQAANEGRAPAWPRCSHASPAPPHMLCLPRITGEPGFCGSELFTERSIKDLFYFTERPNCKCPRKQVSVRMCPRNQLCLLAQAPRGICAAQPDLSPMRHEGTGAQPPAPLRKDTSILVHKLINSSLHHRASCHLHVRRSTEKEQAPQQLQKHAGKGKSVSCVCTSEFRKLSLTERN